MDDTARLATPTPEQPAEATPALDRPDDALLMIELLATDAEWNEQLGIAAPRPAPAPDCMRQPTRA